MRSRLYILAAAFAWIVAPLAGAQESEPASAWTVGTPIVTYFAGPPMSEAVAVQMADGGFNVVWSGEKDFDLLQQRGLRVMLRDGLLSPATLDSPEQREKLDALIARVSKHPAFYSYYIIDEPSAAAFPGLGKLLAYLRERDPRHMAYINLFPTYASNEQLGTQGDTVTAYREHLKQFIDIVKPQLVSYDNYQFMIDSDRNQYFLNLSMIREASQSARVPFLNIVQASSWAPQVRVPVANEMRYLVYTTVAYGAKGISYYVYSAVTHKGGMRNDDGTPTPIYQAVRPLNREFLAIATELQQLRSQAIYHTVMKDPGCQPLPAKAPFRPEGAPSKNDKRGLLLSYFGKDASSSHVVVVNLDYRAMASTTIVGPANLERFDATTRQWSVVNGTRAKLRLPPGGGQLLRVLQNTK